VHLTFAEEDKKQVEEGCSTLHNASPSAFLLLGMDLQGVQYVLYYHLCLSKQTVLQTTSIVERRMTLLKCIQCFHDIQQLYMPGLDPQQVACALQSALANAPSSVNVEDAMLLMPSDLSDAQRHQYCAPGVAAIEDYLRYAEAFEGLNNLQHHLCTHTLANKFKIKNVMGQKNNTQSRDAENCIDDKVKSSQLQYC
ncbi:hypothetical protein PILCRDRAFT_82799, partial [Piloderma croceum F 1598]